MEHSARRRARWWRLVALAVVFVLALAGLAACGDDDEGAQQGTQSTETTGSTQTQAARGKAIKIGVLTTCGGPFAFFEEASFSGAKYALVEQAGAQPAGTKPRDTVRGATVAGKPVEISFGCSDATPDRATEEARRLVENEKVDILLGPLSGDEGIAVAEYAKTQPDITFVNGTSGAQETTLGVKAPNFYRFGGDGAQWMAGLGSHAYNDMKLRNVAILGEDYSYPYTQAAGFVAEFCSLGGQVSQRIWAPLETTDWSTYVTRIPRDVDGVLLLTGGANTVAALRAYTQLGNKVAGRVLGGSSVLDPTAFEVGDSLVGLVGGSPVPLGSDDARWQKYVNGFREAYPDAPAESLFTVLYYDGMTAIVQALEKVDGQLSEGEAQFRAALGKLQPTFPNGKVRLDSNRNSIQPNYVVEIAKDGELGFRTLRTVPDVSQTFGGLFDASTKVGRDSPKCQKGDPPPWAQ
jgi:branched-chain amino acid transport system substrate-binding protein